LRMKFISLFLPQYKSIFLANLENIWIQTLLSRFISDSDIYTFDDGTANITEGSYLYKEEDIVGLRKFVFRLIGKKVCLELLKNKSKLHFTIYKSFTNIIDNTQLISLYLDGNEINDYKYNQKESRLFLGQPIYQLDQELYNKIPQYIKKYKIDYYFPHPREDIGYFNEDGVKIIHTELVFEDFIIDKLKDSNCNFKVYTLFSGSILNIAHISNIEIYAIKPNILPNNINSIYEKFLQLGINVIYD
ncbi:MAG: glycosyltransferase family 52, partial [Clostridium celatum]|nr:glycosyltransferase family 52 [Clostridium celatum]